MSSLLQVLVATPAHSRLSGPLAYKSESFLPAGTLVRVPLGSRDTLGLVWPGEASAPEAAQIHLGFPTARVAMQQKRTRPGRQLLQHMVLFSGQCRRQSGVRAGRTRVNRVGAFCQFAQQLLAAQIAQ